MSKKSTAPVGMDIEGAEAITAAVRIIGAAVEGILNNSAPARDRADSALCAFHGILAIAIHNNEMTTEHIAALRRRIQLVHDALDMTDAELKGRH